MPIARTRRTKKHSRTRRRPHLITRDVSPGGPGTLWEPDMGITQSLLSRFKECRRKCALYLNGFQPVGLSEARLFGDLFHLFLGTLYGEVMTKRSVAAIRETMSQSVAMAKRAGEVWLRSQARVFAGADMMQKLEYLRALAEAMFPAYVNRYQEDLLSWRWHGVESEFRVEFGGHLLRGKRDGLVSRERKAQKHPRLWLFETKTRAQVSGDILSEEAFSFQKLFYLLATELETGRPPEGAILNLVRRPGLRQGKTEDWPAFMVRVQKDVGAREDHYFKRYTLTFPPVVRTEFREELEAALDDFQVWAGLQGMPTYKNERACKGLGSCDYLTACATGSLASYARGTCLFTELEES